MPEVKTSYTIPCSSAFRDAVLALSERRAVNAGDLARSVLLTIPARTVALYPDPGGPSPEDRETITLKSGHSAGRQSRRKPRLQVRLPAGIAPEMIRKALNLALAFDSETMTLQVKDPSGPTLGAIPETPTHPAPPPPPPPPPVDLTPQLAAAQAEAHRLSDQLERLRAVLDVVLFEPLADGVQTYGEALFIFGYPPTTKPDSRELRARYRILATVHHPDSPHGSHLRMSQINSAMEILRRGG